MKNLNGRIIKSLHVKARIKELNEQNFSFLEMASDSKINLTISNLKRFIKENKLDIEEYESREPPLDFSDMIKEPKQDKQEMHTILNELGFDTQQNKDQNKEQTKEERLAEYNSILEEMGFKPDPQFKDIIHNVMYAQSMGVNARVGELITLYKETQQLKAKKEEAIDDKVLFEEFKLVLEDYLPDIKIIMQEPVLPKEMMDKLDIVRQKLLDEKLIGLDEIEKAKILLKEKGFAIEHVGQI